MARLAREHAVHPTRCVHPGPVEVCASDPLGLFEVRRRLHQTRRVLVLPYTCPLSMVLPTAEIGFEETARLRQTLSTSANVSGVREYAAGDSLNRIHWPSTARRQKLIAKAFEQDPVGAIWLVLDLERAVHFTSSTAKPVGNFTLLPPALRNTPSRLQQAWRNTF